MSATFVVGGSLSGGIGVCRLGPVLIQTTNADLECPDQLLGESLEEAGAEA